MYERSVSARQAGQAFEIGGDERHAVDPAVEVELLEAGELRVRGEAPGEGRVHQIPSPLLVKSAA